MGRHLAQELHTEDERLSEVKRYSHRTASYKCQWDNTTHTRTANLRRTDYTQCCWDCRARGRPTLLLDSNVVTRGNCVSTTSQKCTACAAALTRDSSKRHTIQMPTAGRETWTTVTVQWGATPRWEWTPLPYNKRDNPIKSSVKWRKPETKGHKLWTQFCSETGHTNPWRQKKIVGRWGCSSSSWAGTTGTSQDRLTVRLLAPYEASWSSSRKTCTFLYRPSNQSNQTRPRLLPRSPQQWRQGRATDAPPCAVPSPVSGTFPSASGVWPTRWAWLLNWEQSVRAVHQVTQILTFDPLPNSFHLCRDFRGRHLTGVSHLFPAHPLRPEEPCPRLRPPNPDRTVASPGA